jgi:hypothetical protein
MTGLLRVQHGIENRHLRSGGAFLARSNIFPLHNFVRADQERRAVNHLCSLGTPCQPQFWQVDWSTAPKGSGGFRLGATI